MRHSFPSIPWAVDTLTGERVKAERAIPYAGKGRYRCVGKDCDEELTVVCRRNGSTYFRHVGGSARGYEEVLGEVRGRRSIHEEACCLLWQRFSRVLQGEEEKSPLLVFESPWGFREVMLLAAVGTPAAAVVREWCCPHSGRRADVAVLGHDRKPILLVEVFCTSGVDRLKAMDFAPYRWIEVEARQVIADPLRLVVRNCGGFSAEWTPRGYQYCLFGE